MTRRTKAQEIVTGYHGPFSSYPEWHAFGIGFYYGARTKYKAIPKDLRNPEAPRYYEDVDDEFHYATFGFDVGDFYRRHRNKIVGGTAALLAGVFSKIAEVF